MNTNITRNDGLAHFTCYGCQTNRAIIWNNWAAPAANWEATIHAILYEYEHWKDITERERMMVMEQDKNTTGNEMEMVLR